MIKSRTGAPAAASVPLETVSEHRELGLGAGLFTTFLCVLFGLNAVAIKISTLGLSPLTSGAVRFSISSVLLFLWAVLTKRPVGLYREQILPVIIIGLGFASEMALLHVGFALTDASRGAILSNLQPFLVLFIAHIFIPQDRITRRKLMGMLLGFAGVVFVFLEKNAATQNFKTGDLCIVTAMVIWAAEAVYTKKVIHRFEPFQLVLYPMILSSALIFVVAFVIDDNMVLYLDGRIIGSLLYQAVVTTCFGFVAWNWLLKQYGAVSLHSYVFIMPITGVISGIWFLNEPVSLKLFIALFLVASGILVVNRTGLFKAKRETP